MVKVYYDKDISVDALKGKTVAVIGYGIQGNAQANNMRDSGINVILGLRKDGSSWKSAQKDGFEVYAVDEAARRGDIVHILIPDETQPEVYKKYIHSNLKAGSALGFSHGFNIRFSQIMPPDNVDVIMVAPKGPGAMVRKTYLAGSGVPALIAVEKNRTGKAKERALAMAKAIGAARVGVLETTFAEEAETDLFGEQVDLCGGCTELVKASFETLVEAGYQPEVAYFECLHELKLIVDLIYAHGIEGMWDNVSNTAEYGGRTRGKRIISGEVKKEMKKCLDEITSGKFAKEWVAEYRAGMPKMAELRKKGGEHQVEKVGEKLRKLMKL